MDNKIFDRIESVEIKNLTKKYGKNIALDNLSLAVKVRKIPILGYQM